MGNENENEAAGGVYRHEYFTYYPGRAIVEVEDESIFLNAIENMLLFSLTESTNRSVSKLSLIEAGWPREDRGGVSDDELSLLRVHLSRLRLKIVFRRDISSPIIAADGLGYTLVNSKMPKVSP